MHVVIAESPSPKPYNAMATLSFKQFLWRAPRTILKELPKPYYAWLIAIFIGSQSMLSQTASAEDKKGSAAQAALMPWQLLGLDGEFPVRHRQLLSELRELAKNIWLSQAVSLDQQAANQGVPLSLNQKLLSQNIQVGRSRAKLQTPHYLQPIICPIGNQLLFALELIASDSQHVLAVQQTLVPRAAWENFAAHPQPPISPAAAWQTAANNLLQTTEQPKHDVRRNPFKLRLGLMRGSQDSRTGAHLCLNLLLTQALLSRFTVLSAIGDLEATHLRRVLGIHDPLLRATRELVLDWGMQSKGPHFEIEGRWSEAVR
ncbi:MAG: hypothetical protein NTX25_13750, partial [Proteobacteria bacterium]|nr:hypothetical protein [Pseudomonadota bacterium]